MAAPPTGTIIDQLVISEIAEDENFQRLAADTCLGEEFERLLEEKVCGYTQKKRLQEGLKTFTKKVEDLEYRTIVQKSVGKFKTVDEEDKAITDAHNSAELKVKLETIKTSLQTMLDEGKISAEEKPAVLDSLRTRLAAAKAAGKAKLEEKLDNMMTIVIRSVGYEVPVANLPAMLDVHKQVRMIERFERISKSRMSAAERDKIESKPQLQEAFEAMVQSSAMWFETAIEFKPRLHKALEWYEANEKEEKERAEQEQFDKERKADEEEFEKKQKAKKEKENKEAEALEAKLEAKRLEALAKPQKEVAPPPVKKVHAKAVKVDVKRDHWFVDPEEEAAEEARKAAEDTSLEEKETEMQELLRELAAARKEAAKEKAAAEKIRAEKKANEPTVLYPVTAKLMEEAAKLAAKKAAAGGIRGQAARPAAPQPVPKKAAEKASMWGTPAAVEKDEEEDDIDTEYVDLGPSLAESRQKALESKHKQLEEKLAAKRAEVALRPVKAAPEPKKKEKKTVTKMGTADWFDGGTVAEKENRDIAAREAREAVAEAEADAAYELEVAAWKAAQMELAAAQKELAAARVAAVSAKGGPDAKAAAVAVTKAEASQDAPTPLMKEPVKPVRKAPAVLVSKWGAPVVAQDMGEYGEGEALPGLGYLAAEGAVDATEMPSLGEALAKPTVKKGPPPAPKKKEKKKFGKLGADLLGFDY